MPVIKDENDKNKLIEKIQEDVRRAVEAKYKAAQETAQLGQRKAEAGFYIKIPYVKIPYVKIPYVKIPYVKI